MGSVPSTPNRDGSEDPWWPIENQNLTLNPNEVAAAAAAAAAMGEHQSDVQSNANRTDLETENDENVNCDEIVKIMEAKNIVETGTNGTRECVSVDAIDVATKENLTKSDQSLEEFKEELRVKREKRQNAIAELRNEISNLRNQLAAEKALNKQLIDEKNCISQSNGDEQLADVRRDVEDDSDINNHINRDNTLRIQLADVQMSLQNANGEILRLTAELVATKKQVSALKEVISASKEMVEIRDSQLQQVS